MPIFSLAVSTDFPVRTLWRCHGARRRARARAPRANMLNNATVSHPARRQSGKFLSSLENGRIVRFVV